MGSSSASGYGNFDILVLGLFLDYFSRISERYAILRAPWDASTLPRVRVRVRVLIGGSVRVVFYMLRSPGLRREHAGAAEHRGVVVRAERLRQAIRGRGDRLRDRTAAQGDELLAADGQLEQERERGRGERRQGRVQGAATSTSF